MQLPMFCHWALNDQTGIHAVLYKLFIFSVPDILMQRLKMLPLLLASGEWPNLLMNNSDKTNFGQETFKEALAWNDAEETWRKKTDLPVAKIRINQISQRKQDGENLLGYNDRESKHWSWFSQGHEGHQMHPFVFGFFQKSMDPSMVSLHSS